MDLQLTAKLAVVTGSTKGIGLAIATSLAREGARVVVNGRTQAAVDTALEEIVTAVPGARVEGFAGDLSTASAADQLTQAFPAVDILVNNLGIYESKGFFDETDADWQRIFEVNILSGVRLSRHYLQGMLARKQGRVVFISSESGVSPSPEMPHYAATKTMQLSLSRSLAELTKGTAVTVNTVMPGSTLTEGVTTFVQGLFPGLSLEEAGRRFIRENRPTSLIERLIKPEEIAHFVTFVCSPLASAVNGAALRVDGGLVRSVF